MIDPYELTPWVEGPYELLDHALELVGRPDSGTSRRVSMIAIDNAVEIMARAFLSTPGRPSVQKAGGLGFHRLLSAVRDAAPDSFEQDEMQRLTFFHNIRNEMYHGGCGMTVDRPHVERYARLARQLFHSLFGIEAPLPRSRSVGDLVRSGQLQQDDEALTMLARLRMMAAANEDQDLDPTLGDLRDRLTSELTADRSDADVSMLIREVEEHLRATALSDGYSARSGTARFADSVRTLEETLEGMFLALYQHTHVSKSMGWYVVCLRPLLPEDLIGPLASLVQARNEWAHAVREHPDQVWREHAEEADRVTNELQVWLLRGVPHEAVEKWRRQLELEWPNGS